MLPSRAKSPGTHRKTEGASLMARFYEIRSADGYLGGLQVQPAPDRAEVKWRLCYPRRREDCRTRRRQEDEKHASAGQAGC